MAFEIPQGWENYPTQVISRFHLLINTRVVDGIDNSSLKKWFKNFNSDLEKYFAAHLLDSLVFRTQRMLAASYQQIQQKLLPDILRKHDSFDFEDNEDFISKLKSQATASNLRYVSVSGDYFDTPGKSGEVLLRDFCLETGVSKRFTKRPNQIIDFPDCVNTIVLLDDFVGTGRQFTGFVDACLKQYLRPSSFTFIYIPIIGHQDGISSIRRSYPELIIAPLETIDETYNFFNQHEGVWVKDRYNSINDVKEFYLQFIKDKGIGVKNPYGVGDLGLNIHFSHSSPNNSLNIMYSNKNDWSNLLKRGST